MLFLGIKNTTLVNFFLISKKNKNDSESKRSTDFEDIEGDNLERVDDNEFQESFKSLQRRDDEAEFNEAEDENSELDADRQERDFEEDTDETPVELNE